MRRRCNHSCSEPQFIGWEVSDEKSTVDTRECSESGDASVFLRSGVATELKVMTSVALTSVLNELAPEFEKASR
jgi:hypothetical protein